MPSISKIDMSGFAELAKQQSLADIKFDMHSDLNRVHDVLSERVIAKFPMYTSDKDNLTQEEFTDAVVEILDDLQEEPDLTPIEVEMQNYANRLYQDTQGYFHKLKYDIAPTVDALLVAIQKGRETWLRANGYQVLLEADVNDTDEKEDPLHIEETPLPEGDGGQTPPALDPDPSATSEPVKEGEGGQNVSFSHFKWDSIFNAVGGEENLVGEVEILCNMKNLTSPSHMPSAYLPNHMVTTIFDIEVNDADFEDAVKQAKRVLGKDIKEEQIRETLSLLFNKTPLNTYRDNLLVRYSSASAIHQCNTALTLTTGVLPILRAAKKLSLYHLSMQQLTQLNNNIRVVNELCLAFAYQAYVHRHLTYKDAILMSDTELNEDNLDDYTEKGGTLSMLADHLRHYRLTHKVVIPRQQDHAKLVRSTMEMQLPNSGVGVDYVMSCAPKVAQEIRMADMNTLMKKNEIHTTATTQAFQHVMYQYAMANEHLFSDALDKEARGYLSYQLAEKLSESLHGSDDNLEHATYQYILGLFHKDTPLQHTYDLFNKVAVAALESANVSKITVDRVNTDVAVTLMHEMLKEHLVK